MSTEPDEKSSHKLYRNMCTLIDEHMREHDDPADVLEALEMMYGVCMTQILVPPAATFPTVQEFAEMSFEMLKKSASHDVWPRPETLDKYFASSTDDLSRAWEEMFSDEPVLVIEIDEEGDLDNDAPPAKKTPDMVN